MNDLSASTSSSLICRVRANEEIAWNRLVRLYAPLVYKWARRVGLSDEDAADIGQEVFRTVAARVVDFHREHTGGFRGWLWQITRNKIGDFVRKERGTDVAIGGSDSRIKNTAIIEPLEESDNSSENEDRQELFGAALQLIQTDFQERTWKAFWRVTIEERSIQEVADDLQMAPKAVRQAKYRVLKRLREEFGDLLG